MSKRINYAEDVCGGIILCSSQAPIIIVTLAGGIHEARGADNSIPELQRRR